MKYNRAYQGEILHRFLGDEGMKELHEEYKNARKVQHRGGRNVSDVDLKRLEMFEDGKTFSEIARIGNTSESVVRTSIMWAALSKTR